TLLATGTQKENHFELRAPVVMCVVCFRFKRDGEDDEKVDSINSKIVETINASGNVYITQTKLRGRTAMRIGLGNILTTEEHLRNAWQLIRETAARIGGSGD